MDERQWLEAVAPDVTYCLGRRLRPFSPGHWILLKRIQSPLLSDCEAVTFADLLDATSICARKFEAAYYGLNSRWYLARGLMRSLILKWGGLRSVNVGRATEVMRAHIRNGLRWPVLFPTGANNDEGAGCASPTCQCLIVHLTSKLHQDKDEIIDWPLGFCYWLYATAAEMTGHAKLSDINEMEDLRAAADDVQARFERGEIRFKL